MSGKPQRVQFRKSGSAAGWIAAALILAACGGGATGDTGIPQDVPAASPEVPVVPADVPVVPADVPVVPADVPVVPQDVPAVPQIVYFVADNGVHGLELWKSDGTAVGTVMVKDINTVQAGRIAGPTVGSFPAMLTPLGSTLFFSAADGVNGSELWKSDGTAAGTVMVADINPVAATGSSPSNLTAVGNLLYFAANDGTNGIEPWKSDGSTATLVANLNPEVGTGSSPSDFTAFGGKVYFSADDFVVDDLTPQSSNELWSTDGTAGGTALVADINTQPAGCCGDGDTASSFPSDLTVAGSTLFFSADDGVKGSELWKSDGTALGTVMVKDINSAGGTGSSPSDFTAFGGKVYFSADDGPLFDVTLQYGRELWSTNGTLAGTARVDDINKTIIDHCGDGCIDGDTASSLPSNFTVVGTTLFFVANDGLTGSELWKFDGAAVSQVKDINPVVMTGSSPHHITAWGGKLYFFANDGTIDTLWRSDGTSVGTVKLSTALGLGPISPCTARLLGQSGSLLLFAHNSDGNSTNELWVSDGSAGGTGMIKELNIPGMQSCQRLVMEA